MPDGVVPPAPLPPPATPTVVVVAGAPGLDDDDEDSDGDGDGDFEEDAAAEDGEPGLNDDDGDSDGDFEDAFDEGGAARQEAMGLGLAINWDGTWRTVATGQPCFFVGTNDVDQHFHLVAGGIIDSENKMQCKEVLDTILESWTPSSSSPTASAFARTKTPACARRVPSLNPTG